MWPCRHLSQHPFLTSATEPPSISKASRGARVDGKQINEGGRCSVADSSPPRLKQCQAMTRGDMWRCRHPFLTSATPRGDMWPCWHPIASIPVSRPRRRPVICGHAASLSHVRGPPPVNARPTAFGSQCQAAHPGPSELHDRGCRKV